MVNKFKTYLKEGFTYTSLEIVASEQGEAYFLLELKKTKNELIITNKKELKKLEDLPNHIKKKHPFFLCVNTSNVLTKKVENTNTDAIEAIVNQAFPNLDLSNFYYEVIQIATNPIVTISRKEPIDAILHKLKEMQIRISKFSLGISAIDTVLPYLNDESITLSNFQINISDTGIDAVLPTGSDTKKTYTINGLELSSDHLLSFSQILGNLNQSSRNTNFGPLTKNLKWEFENHRIFNYVVKYSLIFFLVLLLGNFFVYNFYHEEVGQLNSAMAATGSKKDGLTFLDASVKRKQERVEILSASSNSKVTYYLDLFAGQVPSSILLNGLKYQPLAKPVREKKPILLENGTLLISGISKDVKEFSLWIEELEKYEWINSVETLDYDYISKNTSNFLIEIGFHEN